MELNSVMALISTDDTIPRLDRLTSEIRLRTKAIRDEWELKRTPVSASGYQSLTGNNTLKMTHESINTCKALTKTARIILDATPLEDMKCRTAAITFGRAVARLRCASEDLLSFITQTHPPQKTSNEPLSVTSDQVKTAIATEHLSLGLTPPCFKANAGN